jgi:hypothetical protein
MCFHGMDNGNLPVYFQPQHTLSVDFQASVFFLRFTHPSSAIQLRFTSENRFSGLSRSE